MTAITYRLTDAETATILAALRYWQRDMQSARDDEGEDWTVTLRGDGHFYDQAPLSDEEIDVLCEGISATAVAPIARSETVPTDFHVTWEIDAFSATTPREAAEEARRAMQRADTSATVFTVRAADGTTTVVDLSEEG